MGILVAGHHDQVLTIVGNVVDGRGGRLGAMGRILCATTCAWSGDVSG